MARHDAPHLPLLYTKSKSMGVNMAEVNATPVEGLVIHRVQGRLTDRFRCVHCNEFITDAHKALLLTDSKGTKAMIVHKGICDNAVSGGEHLWSEELDVTLIYLLWNSGLQNEENFKRAKERAEHLSNML